MTERRTPLYDVHVRAGAQMVKGGGEFWFPLSYTGMAEEHTNTRTNVGMQDLSTIGEVDIKGPGAERLVNHLCVNEIRDLFPGQVRYTTMCNEEGGIVDDVTVYKFGEEHLMIVTSSGPRKQTAAWIAEHSQGASAYVCMACPASKSASIIIDTHPQHPQVSFAAGFSGHGYKFASVIGEILGDLAIFGRTRHDISLFRHDRFRRDGSVQPYPSTQNEIQCIQQRERVFERSLADSERAFVEKHTRRVAGGR